MSKLIELYCHNPNPTSTQPSLTKVWVLHENDFAYHHHPPETQRRQYLSCYCPNFVKKFKGRFLGKSRTDSNYYRDICPGNICPSNIRQYREYLSCFWPNFDPILKVGSREHLEQIPSFTVTFVLAIFVLTTFVYFLNNSAVTDLILTKF